MFDNLKLLRLSSIFAISIIIIFSFAFLAVGQDTEEIITDSVDTFIPLAVTNVVAVDHVYDRGDAVDVTWWLSLDDEKLNEYKILRAEEGSPDFIKVGVVMPGNASFMDKSVESGQSYIYKIAALFNGNAVESEPSNIVIPDTEFVNWNLLNLFVIGLLIAGAVIYFIAHAKAGKKLFIRKIAGLEAIDEAIGRATEMGRPILFIPGINDMDDVQTIAGITLLGRVAKVVADYDIKINMPVARSLVMTTARETIREAYIGAGRPDAYDDDMVRYITDEQFGYVAAVDGIMVREKPATCFYLGAFYAESLILAETGNSIGAIQIAGTAMPSQLPFFVAACDYTLIGEELFAASAYLSGEPKQLGSLKGQDVGKLLAMVALIIGVASITISESWGGTFFIWLTDTMHSLFTIRN